MSQAPSKTQLADPLAATKLEEEIAYLAKRLRVTPAVIREVIKRVGSSERSAVQREIERGSKARR